VEEEGRSNRSTVAWVSAIGGLLAGIAAVAALLIGLIGGGDGDGNGGSGPQYDVSRAEQEALTEAVSAARQSGWQVSADDFFVSCEPRGSGGDTQIWNCSASGANGACGGTVIIALDSSGLASLRENNVGCAE